VRARGVEIRAKTARSGAGGDGSGRTAPTDTLWPRSVRGQCGPPTAPRSWWRQFQADPCDSVRCGAAAVPRALTTPRNGSSVVGRRGDTCLSRNGSKRHPGSRAVTFYGCALCGRACQFESAPPQGGRRPKQGAGSPYAGSSTEEPLADPDLAAAGLDPLFLAARDRRWCISHSPVCGEIVASTEASTLGWCRTRYGVICWPPRRHHSDEVAGSLPRLTACVSGMGSELNCPDRSPDVPRSTAHGCRFEPWTNVHSLDSGYISGALRLQKPQGWTACGPSGTRRLPADWLQYGLWSLSLALCSADSRLAVQNMKRKLRGGPWAARRAGGRGGACVSCRLTQRLPARSGARVSL